MVEVYGAPLNAALVSYAERSTVQRIPTPHFETPCGSQTYKLHSAELNHAIPNPINRSGEDRVIRTIILKPHPGARLPREKSVIFLECKSVYRQQWAYLRKNRNV